MGDPATLGNSGGFPGHFCKLVPAAGRLLAIDNCLGFCFSFTVLLPSLTVLGEYICGERIIIASCIQDLIILDIFCAMFAPIGMMGRVMLRSTTWT